LAVLAFLVNTGNSKIYLIETADISDNAKKVGDGVAKPAANLHHRQWLGTIHDGFTVSVASRNNT
jgi:hypothetical protein